MTIREATAADLPTLVTMGRRFQREVFGVLADNPAHLEALGQQLLARADSVLFVADGAAGVVGMIGMMVVPHLMSGERVATELFWWTEPEHRGVGLRLFRQAEAWARAHDAVFMQMEAPTLRDLGQDVGVLYQRLGFVEVERTYLRRFA